MGAREKSGCLVPQAAELSVPVSARRGRRAMLASRVARGSWGALRGAAWAPRARRGKECALGALLSPAPWCLAERWWLRPAALGLQLPGAFSRGHCSGAGKATPGPTAGGGAAAEARGSRWGPASAASLVRTEEERRPRAGCRLCGAQSWMLLRSFGRSGCFLLRTFKALPEAKLREGYSVGMNLRGTNRVHLQSRSVVRLKSSSIRTSWWTGPG